MTTAELENEVLRLKVHLRVLVSCLTEHTTLPILGPMKNWKRYEAMLREELDKDGLSA